MPPWHADRRSAQGVRSTTEGEKGRSARAELAPDRAIQVFPCHGVSSANVAFQFYSIDFYVTHRFFVTFFTEESNVPPVPPSSHPPRPPVSPRTIKKAKGDFCMLNIAIDGPVGAGKSTIADEVAARLHILHLDTGAMYRAVGLAVMDAGLDIQDEAGVTALCAAGRAHVDVRYQDGAQRTLVNGQDVTGRIRTQQAGTAASAVSRYAAVRQMLVRRQQEIAAAQPMLLDGRDICTVVLPNAPVKIYLTASAEARAQRRLRQLQEKGESPNFEDILREVNARDHQDMTRAVDPLRQAPDAQVVDSTNMNFEQTVQAILDIVEAAHAE